MSSASTGAGNHKRGWSSLILAILAGAAAAILALPVVVLVLGVSWDAMVTAITSGQLGPALALSTITTLIATTVCILIGVPLAWRMSGMNGRAVRFLRALVLLPLVLPPVAGGVALLLIFGRNGPLGSVLAETGLSLPFTTTAVVISQVFVALPFMVLASEAAFRSVDPQQHDVARSLGASQWRRFVSIGLPLAAPGIAAGALLSWARAFGEFGATVTFAGSLPGVTQTLPLALYRALESDQDVAIALAVVMLIMSVAVVLILGTRWLPIGGFSVNRPPTRPLAGTGSSDPDRDIPGQIPTGNRGQAELRTLDPSADPAASENPDGIAQPALVAELVVPRPDFDVEISLRTEPGEVLVIRGPNGAGKSTVLLALAGLVPTHTANVALGPAIWDSPTRYVPPEGRSIGWVPQSGQLFWHLTVRDNIAFGVLCKGERRAVARRVAQLLLQEQGLASLADRKASQLSGGQARRVAVLRAVAANPAALLLDEPTNGLDEQSRQEVVAWLSSWLGGLQQPTVLVTHDAAVAKALGTSEIRMVRGQVLTAKMTTDPVEPQQSQETCWVQHDN